MIDQEEKQTLVAIAKALDTLVDENNEEYLEILAGLDHIRSRQVIAIAHLLLNNPVLDLVPARELRAAQRENTELKAELGVQKAMSRKVGH